MKMRWQTIASNVSIRTISPTATPLPKAYDCVAVYIGGPPHPSRRIMVGGRSRQPKRAELWFSLLLTRTRSLNKQLSCQLFEEKWRYATPFIHTVTSFNNHRWEFEIPRNCNNNGDVLMKYLPGYKSLTWIVTSCFVYTWCPMYSRRWDHVIRKMAPEISRDIVPPHQGKKMVISGMNCGISGQMCAECIRWTQSRHACCIMSYRNGPGPLWCIIHRWMQKQSTHILGIVLQMV